MKDVRETTILEEGEVTITSARAIIGTKTYAISDILSATLTRDSSMVGCLILTLISGAFLLGLLSLGGGSGYRVAAFIFLGAAIVVGILAQPSYIVQIRSVSGNTDVLRSMDQDYLQRVVDAINDALMYRSTEREVQMVTQS